MHCLFCVLCIVCVYICTVLLPPGGYPIAVKYIVSYIISSIFRPNCLNIYFFQECYILCKCSVQRDKSCDHKFQ